MIKEGKKVESNNIGLRIELKNEEKILCNRVKFQSLYRSLKD